MRWAVARGAIDDVAGLGPADALTGPVARFDRTTVRRHLDALDDREGLRVQRDDVGEPHAAASGRSRAVERVVEEAPRGSADIVATDPCVVLGIPDPCALEGDVDELVVAVAHDRNPDETEPTLARAHRGG